MTRLLTYEQYDDRGGNGMGWHDEFEIYENDADLRAKILELRNAITMDQEAWELWAPEWRGKYIPPYANIQVRDLSECANADLLK